MTVKRLVPQGMQTTETAAGTSKSQTTARVENVDEGKCPICKKPLHFSEANNIPVMVCDDHAIVMPIKD